MEEVRAQAAEQGMAERIDFRGDVADPVDFWDDCHVAVLLSDHEGSPNSLLEAARAGRPMLSTAVGGSIEAVPPDAGFLVYPDDDAAAAARLAELIASPELRVRLGAGARKLVLTRHDPDAVAQGHLEVLLDAIEGPGPRLGAV